MSAFYYYVPQRGLIKQSEGIKPADFKGTPLQHLFEQPAKVPDDVIVWEGYGPDSKQGTLIYRKPHGEVSPPFCFYNADSQVWLQFEDVWVGREEASELPKPLELAKSKTMHGGVVVDKLDQQWIVPVCRAPSLEQVTLPVCYGYDSTGKFVERVQRDYQYYWDLAGKAVDLLNNLGQASAEEFTRLALEFLQMNYYVGAIEVYAYLEWGSEILAPEFLGMVLGTATGWSQVMTYEQEKKTGRTVATSTS